MGDEMTATAMVDLGFTATRVPAGTHICQIFNDADERNDSSLRFLASGLAAGECAACFSNTAIDVAWARFSIARAYRWPRPSSAVHFRCRAPRRFTSLAAPSIPLGCSDF
jgi:hypothetical protein